MQDLNASTIRRRFSARAHAYDGLADLQRAAARALLERLPADPPPARVLDVGCGTGLLTGMVAERWPTAGLDALDIAPGMIREASRKFPGPRQPRWITADVLAYRASGAYDLVVSNCALHWLHPFAPALAHIAGLVAPGGRLAFAIMLDGTLAELRAARQRAAPGKPPLGVFPSFDAVCDALAAAGLSVTVAGASDLVDHAESADALLRALSRQGLTGGLLSRAESPLTRGELAALGRGYDAEYRTPRGVPATYRLGCFVAGRGGAG